MQFLPFRFSIAENWLMQKKTAKTQKSNVDKLMDRHPALKKRKLPRQLRDSMSALLSEDFLSEGFADFKEYLQYQMDNGNGFTVMGAKTLLKYLEEGMTMDDMMKLSKVLGEERTSVDLTNSDGSLADYAFFQGTPAEIAPQVVSNQDGEGHKA